MGLICTFLLLYSFDIKISKDTFSMDDYDLYMKRFDAISPYYWSTEDKEQGNTVFDGCRSLILPMFSLAYREVYPLLAPAWD